MWKNKRFDFLLLIICISTLLVSGCTVKQDPEKALEYYNKSIVCAEQNDSEGELTNLQKALKFDESNVQVVLNLGKNLKNKGKFGEAEKIINKLIRHQPNNVELRLAAGINYIEWVQTIDNYLDQGALADKGIKQFNHILALEPDHIDALLYRANTYANYPDLMGVHAQAEIDYLHLLELEKSNPGEQFATVYYYYGDFLRLKGRMDEAYAIWRKGLESYPNNEMILQKLQ